MARRRFQQGCFLKLARKRGTVYAARLRRDVLKPDGTAGRRLEYVTLGFSWEGMTERKAKNVLAEMLRPINQGRQRPQATMTLAEFWGQFKSAVLPTLKWTTQDIYGRLWGKHVEPRWGNERICDLRAPDLQVWLLQKLASGGQRVTIADGKKVRTPCPLAWETVNHLRNLSSKVLRTAVEWGWLAENPMRAVKMPQRFLVRPRTSLTAQEVVRLEGQLAEPWRTLALVLVRTGLRIGEALALRWKHVDLEGGAIRVAETVRCGRFSEPKTQKSKRVVPTGETSRLGLRALWEKQGRPGGDALVWAASNGKPVNEGNLRRRVLRRACVAAKVREIDWHTFRHTFTTLMQVSGVPKTVVRDILGHTRESTTEIYSHSFAEQQQQAVKNMEILFTSVQRQEQDAATAVEQTTMIQ